MQVWEATRKHPSVFAERLELTDEHGFQRVREFPQGSFAKDNVMHLSIDEAQRWLSRNGFQLIDEERCSESDAALICGWPATRRKRLPNGRVSTETL